MFLIRDIMYCKPGKVRPMVEKFKKLRQVMQQMGMGPTRVMTDLTAERYWTVVAETEVADLAEFTKRSREASEAKETRAIMDGYHDLVESGRREIYVIEG
jgi:hypothetical protein